MMNAVKTSLKQNINNHVVFEITGCALTGIEEIQRLQAAGHCVDESARQIFTNQSPNGYDAKHRLIAGQRYEIVLLPGTCFAHGSCISGCMTESFRAEAKKFNYCKPLAGIIPRIHEVFSDEELEELGFQYIAALHDPIGTDGNPNMLSLDCSGDEQWIRGYWGFPKDRWDKLGAFAFFSYYQELRTEDFLM